MRDRVEMNVVSAAFEIAVIANGVFLRSLLPERIFAPIVARDGRPAATTLRVKAPLIRRHRPEI